MAMYRDRKLRFCQKFVFVYSLKYNVFFSNISTEPLECLYVYEYLISDSFLKSQKYAFQKLGALVLMCQRHFSHVIF
jgi:hypothetical protein